MLTQSCTRRDLAGGTETCRPSGPMYLKATLQAHVADQKKRRRVHRSCSHCKLVHSVDNHADKYCRRINYPNAMLHRTLACCTRNCDTTLSAKSASILRGIAHP